MNRDNECRRCNLFGDSLLVTALRVTGIADRVTTERGVVANTYILVFSGNHIIPKGSGFL